jgi:hypothetical protein
MDKGAICALVLKRTAPTKSPRCLRNEGFNLFDFVPPEEGAFFGRAPQATLIIRPDAVSQESLAGCEYAYLTT